VVRYVEEAMVLRVSKIPAEGGVDLIGDEVTVNRSEVVEHLERRREVWNVAGVSATVPNRRRSRHTSRREQSRTCFQHRYWLSFQED